MTYNIVRSIDLVSLVDDVAERLAAAPLPPHEAELIVVPSAGMRRWLGLELARRWGVAASIDTPFPADACARLADALLGRADGEPFTRDALIWRAFEGLARIDDGPIAAYLARDPDDIKRFGLAKRVARVFREMQSTRLDVLAAWEAGESVFTASSSTLADAEAWQAPLWRQLCDHAGVPVSRRLAALHDSLVSGSVYPETLPKRWTLFALGALPPVFIDIFTALGRHVDVTTIMLDPSPAATSMRSPLARTLGAQGRAFRNALRAGADDDRVLEPVDERPATTLTTLQRDLHDDIARAADADHADWKPIDLPSDDSLSLHVCHTQLREIEVVHDLVLDAFRADKSLRPHDIAVLLPDVERYAPYVDAVFARRRRDVRHVPYHIADRVPRVRPLIHAFLRGLDVLSSRFESSDVLGLLEEPAVMRRFGLRDVDVLAARRWVVEASIRWGIDGNHRATVFGQPDDDLLTWRHGLERLLIGLAVGPHDALVDERRPVAGDTVGDTEALGRFALLVETLCARGEQVTQRRTPSHWRDWLTRLLGELVEPDGDDERDDRRVLVEAFATLAETARWMDGDELTINVVRTWLEDHVSDAGFGGGFLTGAVSFAALRPLRTIPFKVVILCGMDDTSFPRRDRVEPFDLIAGSPRTHDRSARDDDRELFLEVLLAARDRLAITYVGRSPRDLAERAVSVCVSELLEHVDRTFNTRDGRLASRALTVVHGLHAYSPREFSGDVRPRSYDTEALDVARQLLVSRREAGRVAPFAPEPFPRSDDDFVLDLDQLVRAWAESVRFFFRESLRIDLREWHDELADREPLVQDPLDSYRSLDELLARALHGTPRDAAEERALLRQLGVLPPGARGDSDHVEDVSTLSELVASVGDLSFRAPEAFLLRGEGWRVTGRLDGIARDAMKSVRAGRVKPKALARAWVEHVVLNAWAAEHPERDLPTTTRVVGTDHAWMLKPLRDPAIALADLVGGARAMLDVPRPFFVEASRQYVETQREGGDEAAALEAARKQFARRGWNGISPGADVLDVHGQLAFRDRVDYESGRWLSHEPDFAALARRLWGPLLEHLEEVDA